MDQRIFIYFFLQGILLGKVSHFSHYYSSIDNFYCRRHFPSFYIPKETVVPTLLNTRQRYSKEHY